ncbi:3'(2'),5'-bisphosphate nucleotidase CysQ [Rhizobiales bacterium TNE-4]|nr:3'(2'),5'-bisphosphate nucleotidase CysQ [Rhizobiales bacterium TNE-4]MBV1826306.1 3'(2'),5'-bisphosphate nucleotidase CysQ [Rhizobiales bacterium TNE-4]
MNRPDAAFLQEALRLATQAALEAGEIALGYFRPGAQTSADVQFKEGGSPVTEADLTVDRMLKGRLGAFDPAIGWLSEETEDDPARLDKALVWVVDPIDGTRSFAQGRPDWGVAIGLLAAGRPVLGVLHVPAEGKTYTAHQGGGAFLNGAAITISGQTVVRGARLSGQQAMLDAVEKGAGTIARLPRIHSLAYRLALVADGTADGGLSSKNPHDWDLAAVHAVINEAGGTLKQIDGTDLHYNRASTRHPSVLAGHPLLVAGLSAILNGDNPTGRIRDD